MKSFQKKSQKAGFDWLLKMAWRDAKASLDKLTLFIASIVLGIAAVVSIQSFGDNVKKNIALQSKSLMGSDFIIESQHPPNQKVTKIMDSLGGANAKEINFSSMAAFPKTRASKLVQVRGIKGGFPFYGNLETHPRSAAKAYQQQKGALVDATLMLQLGVKIGDSIKIGNIAVPILGSLESVPGSSAIFSSVASPVLIPYSFIEKTGLVQTGSRIEYKFYFLAPQMSMQHLDSKLGQILDVQQADLDTHTSTSKRLGRRYENFGKFLNLVAFIALLLGCVGIASAIHIYIKGKLRSVAVLKCLGATKKQSFLIYLLQIAIIGFLGGLVGTLLGLLLQQIFPLFLNDFLPLKLQLSYSPQAIAMGLLLGVFMSVLFALYPLMATLYVSPLQALRVQNENTQKSAKAGIFVLIAIFVFILLFSFWLLQDWKYSLGFIAGIIVTFSVLAGLAHLLMQGIKKYFPKSWGFVARQSLLNLFRPQNQTLILILTIGVGTFLISTLYFSKDLLLAQASLDQSSSNSNMILLDVQTKQQKEVAASIKNTGLSVISNVPIVTMRVDQLHGKSAAQLKKDSTSKVGRWVLNHEFRATYRDSLIPSEQLQEGEFTGSVTPTNIIPISVSDNFARDAKVKLGDSLSFNVQGVLQKTIIGSIRTVDWGRMQLNFSVVFPTGVLEKAPQFRVLTTYAPTEKASAKLQQVLVRKFPNVTIIDLRQVLSIIENLLDKIALLINFMAFFSILTGIIVLIGAVRTSKFQRIRESVLLRTLGARSKQILKIIALEYIYLGIFGSLSGILLAFVGSQILAFSLFDTAFIPSLVPFLILFPGITLLVVSIGILNSRSVIKQPPLEVLRKQNG